jgi:hypothetical protein
MDDWFSVEVIKVSEGRSRLRAVVLPSCLAVMLVLPSDYSMWEPLGNRLQLIGSTESMY